MAEFVVNTVQLNSCANQISGLQRELDSVAMRLAGMQLGSVLQMRASATLIARVGDCKWAAVHQSDNLGKLARGLEDVAGMYDRCETNLSEPKTQAQAEAQAAAAEADGNILSDIADWFQNIPGVLTDLLGEVTDIFIDGAGDVITIITRFMQNASEFGGDLFNPRFWAEFGLESLIDIGKGVLIGAGVAAGVAAVVALAGVTLPAWGTGLLVAGGTVLVSWAIDAVFELFTGNEGGITEWISDNIIDTVVDIGTEIVDNVTDFVEEAVDTAGEVVNDIVDAAGNVIDTVSEGVETAWNGLVDFFT